jgi:hypothetical protein
MGITVTRQLENVLNAGLIVFAPFTNLVRPAYMTMLILDKFLTATAPQDITKILNLNARNAPDNVKIVGAKMMNVQDVVMAKTEQWKFQPVVAKKDFMLKMIRLIVENVSQNARHAITKTPA